MPVKRPLRIVEEAMPTREGKIEQGGSEEGEKEEEIKRVAGVTKEAQSG